MSSRLCYNVIPTDQGIPRKEELMAHLDVLRPKAVLVIDDTSTLEKMPAEIKIFRSYGSHGDQDNHKNYTPQRWVNDHVLMDADRGFWHTTINEPGFDADIIKWHIQVIEKIVERINKGYGPLRIVVMNLQIGFPKNFSEWSLAAELLKLCSKYRDWIIMGFHEYGGGVLFSGVKGGSPNEYYHEGKPFHRDYTRPIENWPTAQEFAHETLFHCGRYKEMLRYCRDVLKIEPPRVIITEHGMDRLNDIGYWLDQLRVTPGYPNVQGWKTLTDQWTEWWGLNGELAYFFQLFHVDEYLYKPLGAEAQLIFTWGASSPMWKPFDVHQALTLQAMLESLVVNPPPIDPPPEPPPSTKFRKFVYDYVTSNDEVATRMERDFKLVLDTIMDFNKGE